MGELMSIVIGVALFWGFISCVMRVFEGRWPWESRNPNSPDGR